MLLWGSCTLERLALGAKPQPCYNQILVIKQPCYNKVAVNAVPYLGFHKGGQIFPLPLPLPSPPLPSPPLPSPPLPSPPLPSPPSPPLPSPPLPSPTPPSPSPPLPSPLTARGSGECCKLPQRGLGRSPSRQRFWCILDQKGSVWCSGVTTAPAAPAMRGALTRWGAQNFRTNSIHNRFLFEFVKKWSVTSSKTIKHLILELWI